MKKIFEYSAFQIVEKIRNGELSSIEYINALFDRIKTVDSKIHAYLTVAKDMALDKAKEIDKKTNKGEHLGRLCGVGMAIKDNICTESIRTTCSSKSLSISSHLMMRLL